MWRNSEIFFSNIHAFPLFACVWWYETNINKIYCSPPPDSNWRRTNSDSALHQSSVAPRDMSPQGGSPHHHHHGSNHHHQNVSHHLGGQLPNFGGQMGQLQQHTYSHSHHGINMALHHSPLPHRRGDYNLCMSKGIDYNPSNTY